MWIGIGLWKDIWAVQQNRSIGLSFRLLKEDAREVLPLLILMTKQLRSYHFQVGNVNCVSACAQQHSAGAAWRCRCPSSVLFAKCRWNQTETSSQHPLQNCTTWWSIRLGKRTKNWWNELVRTFQKLKVQNTWTLGAIFSLCENNAGCFIPNLHKNSHPWECNSLLELDHIHCSLQQRWNCSFYPAHQVSVEVERLCSLMGYHQTFRRLAPDVSRVFLSSLSWNYKPQLSNQQSSFSLPVRRETGQDFGFLKGDWGSFTPLLNSAESLRIGRNHYQMSQKKCNWSSYSLARDWMQTQKMLLVALYWLGAFTVQINYSTAAGRRSFKKRAIHECCCLSLLGKLIKTECNVCKAIQM